MPKSDQTSSNKMDLLDKRQNEKTDIITYRFTITEETMTKVPVVHKKINQLIPTVCASLSCLPFGLMLGWPSPTNPILLRESSPIPITIDQSAMIAGFLMIGNAIGTPISRQGIWCSKFGIIIGNLFMIAGWILMWQSRNIYWLLGSRFLIGFGNGYGTGQLKIYISNICDENLKLILTKLINLYVYLGIIIIFSFAPFIDFRNTSIICLLISAVIFSILIFLPTTPVELIKANKINNARKLISKLKPSLNVNNEITRISESIKSAEQENSLIKIVKKPVLRNNFFVFVTLVFCQQFSGAPATLIYTQILFQESHCPFPEYLAIAYAVVFFISNILGIFIIPKYNKKTALLLSNISVILLIIAKILIIHFRLNDEYWNYSSVVVLFLFIIAHTLGLGNIPFTLIPDFFPSSYRRDVTHFFIVFHSILALIITKIFQVLMSQYNVAIPFYLFLGISIFCMLFIHVAVPNNQQNVHVSIDVVTTDVKIKGKPIN